VVILLEFNKNVIMKTMINKERLNMKYLYCYLEKIGELVIGAVMLLIAIVFFIFGFTAMIPVVGIFIAVPIIALSVRFFRAPLSKTCSL